MAVPEIIQMKGDIDSLKSHYKRIGDDVKNINENTKEIKDCLIGNSVSKDGGVIGRVLSLEAKVQKLSDLVNTFEYHFKIIIFIGTVLFVAIISALVKLYFGTLNN